MTTKAFSFAKTPIIHFGVGKFDSLISQILRFGHFPLFILGKSFYESTFYEKLIHELAKNNLDFEEEISHGEPSPRFIDGITQKYADKTFDVVVSIGGGSVIDSGKAISAMLREAHSVKDYLEGMEVRAHSGKKVPFIAVPTTSGTGSEATKNSVISEIGPGGFKRSLRHENFVPDVAIIDPALTLSCSKSVTASCGLDALTQLIESYVSIESSPMSDALALSGLHHFAKGFRNAYENGQDLTARTSMSYASLISGIVLANSGLGTIHGFASSIGGFYMIPHGVICGTLLGEVTDIAIKSILDDEEAYPVSIKKYETLSKVLTGNRLLTEKESCLILPSYLKELIQLVKIPTLGEFGITPKDIDKIATETTNKNSPYKLNMGQLKQALKNRL